MKLYFCEDENKIMTENEAMSFIKEKYSLDEWAEYQFCHSEIATFLVNLINGKTSTDDLLTMYDEYLSDNLDEDFTEVEISDVAREEIAYDYYNSQPKPTPTVDTNEVKW